LLLRVVALLLVAATGGATAATITARLSPEVLGIKDEAVLDVSVSAGATGALATPQLPHLDGWQVVSRGSSRNMSFVGGELETSVTYSYTLRPLREGTLTIPAISVEIGGERIASEPLTAEVKSGSLTHGRGRGRRSLLDDPFARRRNRGSGREIDPYQHVEIETRVDRRECWVGEQVTLAFRLATSPYIRFDRQPLYTAPEVAGAWVEALGDQMRRTEVRGGVEWEVVEIRYALFPTTAGVVTVGPAKLDGVVNAGSMDIFSMMRRSGRRLLLETDPIEISAAALPEADRPKQFAGAVGQYRVRADVERDHATANDPLTLTIEVSGIGNLNTVPEPALPEVEGLRFFEPQSEVELAPQGARLAGRRVFTRLIVPESAGTIILPELELNFFDPVRESYRSTRSSAMRIEVLPDQAQSRGPIVTGLSKEEVKRLKAEIEYIKTDLSRIEHQGGQSYDGGGFWAMAGAPLLAIAGALAIRRRRHLLETDVGYARGSRAMKRLESRLAELRSIPEGSNQAWALASRVLLDFVGDKLNLNAAGLTTDETLCLLESSELPDEVVAEVREFLSACDLARYASASFSESQAGLVERVRALARRIDKPSSAPAPTKTGTGRRQI